MEDKPLLFSYFDMYRVTFFNPKPAHNPSPKKILNWGRWLRGRKGGDRRRGERARPPKAELIKGFWHVPCPLDWRHAPPPKYTPPSTVIMAAICPPPPLKNISWNQFTVTLTEFLQKIVGEKYFVKSIYSIISVEVKMLFPHFDMIILAW